MKEANHDIFFGDSITHSKPMIGKTMLGLLKNYGTDLHKAHALLIEELKILPDSCILNNWADNIILFRYFENNKNIITNEKYSLIGSSLILNWICGRILNQIPNQADLVDAEIWFQKSSRDTCISNSISLITHELILKYLRKLDIHLMLGAFPYLAEVFETGNETVEEKGAKRTKKKNNGIYYTPTDVIDFIVSRSVLNRKDPNSSIENLKWYDPALGTGSFLISVLKYYSKTDSQNLISYSKLNLFGSDISPHALQSAAYIIATNCLVKNNYEDIKKASKIIGSNLALTDATTLRNNEQLANLFPEIGNGGVDFIVSNPPYSKKQQNQLALFNEDCNGSTNFGENLYPDFIKILLDLTSKYKGGGGMVVPLSLVASSKEIIKKLRNYIQSKNGSFEFWNFDRTPDSLFGDDVKTRNTIFFFSNSELLEKSRNIKSTYLHRWSSRNRETLFNSISLTSLGNDIDIINGVPKVGDVFGVEILNQINNNSLGSLSEVLKSTENLTDLITKTTAYNWLPIELNTNDSSTDTPGRVSWEIKANEISAPTVYAVLNSRITYWLWRLWSDGFHLTNQFIYNLPFGNDFFSKIDKNKTEQLGLNLWNSIQSELIVSKNAGVISHSYCPFKSSALLDEIDDLIITIYDLPNTTSDYLKKYIAQLIIAGREKENRTIIKMKYLEPVN